MKRSTIELCLAFLANSSVQQLGEHRDEVIAAFDAMDDLQAALTEMDDDH